MPPIAPAARTTLVRGKYRAASDADSITSILDAGFLCDVGFTVDGEARVIPTAYVRVDEAIYLHGHLQNQMLNALLGGQIVCICVTILDGLVLARSGFHHSLNYRSVTLFGRAEQVPAEQKIVILDTLVNRLVADRASHLRAHTPQELNATLVVKIPIDEAAAKVRSGPPIDAEQDYDSDTWAGVVKVETVLGDITPCPRLANSVPIPEHVLQFRKQGKLFQ